MSRLLAEPAGQIQRGRARHAVRWKVITQLTSHAAPLSVEKACSHRAELAVMWDQMKRVRVITPSIRPSA
jgi:hypothetical protein